MITADAVREIALGLPGASERETWGHPTFRIGEKMFMCMASDGSTVSVKASKEAQAACVGSDPERRRGVAADRAEAPHEGFDIRSAP